MRNIASYSIKRLVYLIGIPLVFTATSASAGLIGVKSIEISSAVPTWLQVSEVVAIEAGTGNDLALSSAGATATGSIYGPSPGSSPNFAIDGVGPTGFPNIFHSATAAATEVLTITLASASELTSLTLFGRTNCCSDRNIYNVSLKDASGIVLQSFSGLDATGSSDSGTVTLLDTSVPVPAPATLALFGFGLVGLGWARRKQQHS